MATQVGRNIREELKQEFAEGAGPYGAWQRTVRGRAALVSKKIPYAFTFRVDRGEVQFVGRSPRGWLKAQHEGHTFPARQVAANRQHLSFNSKGKLVAERRIFDKKGNVRRG